MTIPRTPKPDTSVPAFPPDSSTVERRPKVFDKFTYEPSSRWVRGTYGDTAIVDSQHQLLVWEPQGTIPEYAFPLSQVRTDLLKPSTDTSAAKKYWRPKTKVEWFDLVLPEKTVPCVAWKWAALDGWIAFSWQSGLSWWEEEEGVHTHARDPAVRIDPIPTKRHVVVKDKKTGDILAESTNLYALFERFLPTRFYFPPKDVKFDLMDKVKLRTSCPYKGHAEDYWALKSGGDPVAWSYAEPMQQVAAIKGLVAFASPLVEITVDGKPFVGPDVWA